MALKGSDVGEAKRSGYTYRGQEILLSKTRGRPWQGLVKKGMAQGNYPVTKQQEAALLYAVTGSYELSSERSGVPIAIIRDWSKEPWFGVILQEFRHENLQKLDAAFTEVIDKAIIEIKDRLENGDFVRFDKEGKPVRRPVAIRDLAIVQAINIDKRQLLRGEPTARTAATNVTPEALLESLADKFKQLVEKRRKPITIEAKEIQDAEFIESPSQSNGSGGTQLPIREESGRTTEGRS